MEERKYTKQLLEAIRKREYVMQENGVPILIKPIPDTSEEDVLDPRFYDSIAPMLSGIKGGLVKLIMKIGSKKKKDAQSSAKQMRNMMDGVKSIPIVGSVDVKKAAVKNGTISVPIRIYTPKKKSNQPQPVFYYIHGGGFVAGSMDVVDEMCKLIVEQTGCVSVQVEYRLAPENPYPAGLDDCYTVLGWIHDHAEEFGGDGERICISGDSAGGNLAAVCAMRDRDEGRHYVKAEALLYPTVDAAHLEQNMGKAKSIYKIAEKHRNILFGMLDMMGGSLNGMTMGQLLGVEDDLNPEISPYLAELAGMPPTILLYGEYDFLRVENDEFCKKLHKAGVEVKAIRYRGLSHGFADQVGVTPQAEDALAEIGSFMMQHVK